MTASSSIVLAAIACGPGDLHYLMAGDGAAATEPPPDPTDPCNHAREPSAPSKQDDQRSLKLTFATDDMRFDTGRDPDSGLSKPKGLDLDDTCSCGVADAAPSCEAPLGTAPKCDKDDQGRDNVAGDLLQVALGSLQTVIGPDAIYANIHKGFYAVLVNVTAWNGTPNDDQVGVSLLMSPGVDNPKDDFANLIPPKFDGNDVWKVEPGSIHDGNLKLGKSCEDIRILCEPIALDVNGYVRDGKLVAHFDTVPFSFGPDSSRIVIPFNSATLLATISGTEPSFRLDGELVGRWPSESILQAVASASITNSDGTTVAVCNQPSLYATFRTQVCLSADLAATRKDDKKGKRCTTLSQSLRFTAIAAHLGPVTESTTQTGSGVCPPDLDTTCPK